jgi:hypothetical protein
MEQVDNLPMIFSLYVVWRRNLIVVAAAAAANSSR